VSHTDADLAFGPKPDQARFLLDLSQVTTNELAPVAGSAFTSFLSLCCHRREANPRWSSHLVGMMLVI
jgi:hypothetical protein